MAEHKLRRFTLVLEDLTQSGASLRSTSQALSPAEASTMLAALAQMHRHWWGRTGEQPWLSHTPRREQTLDKWLSPLITAAIRIMMPEAEALVLLKRTATTALDLDSFGAPCALPK